MDVEVFVEGDFVADVLGVVAFDHHVGLADGVGLGIDLLAVKIVIEIRFKLKGISEQALEGELGGVIEHLAGRRREGSRPRWTR